MLDWGAGLDWLHLESGAYIRKHRWAERQRLGMVLLPSLVFSSQVEGPRVLHIGGQNNRLVPSFAGKLDSEVPGIEGNEDEVEVLGRQMLCSECVEPRDSISKGTRVSHMLPC